MRPILRLRRLRLGELPDLCHTEQGSRAAGMLRPACSVVSSGLLVLSFLVSIPPAKL